MTAAITTATETHPYLVVALHEGNTEAPYRAYTDPSSARRAGRKLVADMDAIGFRVDEFTAEPELSAETVAEIEDALTAAPFVPEYLGDEDEMNGFVEGPLGRTRYQRKVRVFLDPAERFTYGDHEVRVITATKADKHDERLTFDAPVSVFGHRAGLVATVVLRDLPGTLHGALASRNLI